MADENIVIATFEAGRKRSAAVGLWQWDYGQILQIAGLTDLPAVTEVHFMQSGMAKTVLGQTADDVCQVPIPNAMLQRSSQITAFLYLHTGEDSGETEYQIRLPVKPRARPESYDEDDPEIQQEYTALVQATELLNQTTEQVVIDAGEAAQAVIDEFLARPLYPSDGIEPTN